MKSRLCIAVVAAVALALAGCGGSSPDNNADAPAAAATTSAAAAELSPSAGVSPADPDAGSATGKADPDGGPTPAKVDPDAEPAPADSKTTTGISTPDADAASPEEYCGLAKELNDIDLDDTSPAADVKRFVDVAHKLADTAPSEIRAEAKTYFGELAKMVEGGEVEPDLAVQSKEFQESFAAVAGYVIDRCG